MLARIFLIIFSSSVSFHCSQNCLEERLDFRKNWFNVTEKKGVNLFIRNTSNKDIKLPEWLYQGLQDDPDTEVYLEIMRKTENGSYSEIEKKDVDYDYLLLGRKFQTLGVGKETEYKINLELFYDLSIKGMYRVRATLKFKDFANCSNEITSFQEFEVR